MELLAFSRPGAALSRGRILSGRHDAGPASQLKMRHQRRAVDPRPDDVARLACVRLANLLPDDAKQILQDTAIAWEQESY
jgi:hypothetical protein